MIANLPFRIESAIEDVKRILDEARNPQFFTDVDHKYEDKYALAEYVVNMGLASQVNCLETLGLDNQKMKQLLELSDSGKRSITLRFVSKESCTFLRKEEVEIDGGGKLKTEVKKSGLSHKTVTTSVAKIVNDYYWKLNTNYTLMAYVGSDPKEAFVVLKEGTFSGEVAQRETKKNPRKQDTQVKTEEVVITHLAKLIDWSEGTASCKFSIDRESDECRTPLNNPDVERAAKTFNKVGEWANKIFSYFSSYAHSLPSAPGEESEVPMARKFDELASAANQKIFVPILLMFVENAPDRESNEQLQTPEGILASVPPSLSLFQSPVLTADDSSKLLQEHRRTLTSAREALQSNSSLKPFTGQELYLCVAMLNLSTLSTDARLGVNSIDEALRNQLVTAVGKHIQAEDFAEYMRFHTQRLLKPEFAPKPFCFAIRRPNHYPEGTLSILSDLKSDNKENVYPTLSRKMDSGDSLTQLPINAATNVQIGGDRYVHALVMHEFEQKNAPDWARHGSQSNHLQLVARARQFSCFMLVLGTISGPNTFDPTEAIILQNKDELIIPLVLEQMPSPKEFKDAIQSLSPEQQRFAKAFRNMQLSSSVFGVMIIQLKPQLETLLNLPDNSLTKEVKLTQSLLELFIDYQIPSDLLTFDGEESASMSDKVAKVKNYVKSVEDMVSETQKKVVAAEEKKAEMRYAMSFGSAPNRSATRLPEQPEMMMRGAGGSDRKLMMMKRSAQPAPQMACASSMDATMGSSYEPAVAADEYLVLQSEVLQVEAPAVEASVTRETSSSASKSQDIKFGKNAKTDSDLSSLPKLLDAQFEKLDEEGALRPTKVKTGDVWTKSFQKNILSKLESQTLSADEQRSEKNKAFDLLDALSRSGSLPIHCAELHVMVAASHCFDRSLIETVIHDNVNPIEKFERSVLIVTSTLHSSKPADLIASPPEVKRIMELSPKLLEIE